MVALSSWIRGNHFALIWCSAVAVLVFRSELAIFLGIIILIELCYKRLTIFRYIKKINFFIRLLKINQI